MGLLTWIFTGGASEAIKGAAGIGQALATGYAAKQKSLTDQHGISTKAATEITLSGYQTDLRFGELQATLNLADRAPRATAWIRPYFMGLSAWFCTCQVLEHTVPALTRLVGIQTSPLPFPLDYLMYGAPLVILGLRPWEKKQAGALVTTAQSNIVRAPARVAVAPFRREDAQ